MTFPPKLKLQENLSQCLPMSVKITLLMTTTHHSTYRNRLSMPTEKSNAILEPIERIPFEQGKVGSLGGQTWCSIHHADQGQQ